ncbi:unnamed protein product [Rotaria sp. Silwood1]|nr:unnamed protein product [Rotaria sp. Silwood1]
MSEAPTKYKVLFYNKLNNHQHIINTFGFVENNFGTITLLQERASHGHFQELLKKKLFEPSSMVLIVIFLQIIDAMVYNVGKGMIHDDLRCSNVLVFQMDSSKPEENFVKLTNFALARPNKPSLLDDRRSTIPVEYCAPEILRSAGRLNYSELSEIYSMGVLMWEACSQGHTPYGSSISNKEVRQKKLNGDCWYNEPQLRDNFKVIKTQLSSINLESHFQYELDVDVKINNQLHDDHGQIFYNAEWVKKNKPLIILIVINTETAEREASFYIELSSHEHIFQTFGLVKNDPRSTMLIQERAPHGNLLKLLQSQQFKLSVTILVTIFSQIVDAMIYIIEQDIIHGDLLCSNVLVFQMNPFEVKGNLVKLTNFSLSRINDPSNGQTNYSELSDVYSMGILMWEACSQGEVPYGTDTSDNDIRQRKLKGEQLSMPNKCDRQIWNIIINCWYNEPQLRYNFTDMKKRLSNFIPESIEIYEYQLNINVRKENPFNGHYGKFYEADWIPKREPPIILMILNKETAQHDASFYLTLNAHPHIIHTFGFVGNNDRLPMLLQERATHGNLQILLQSKRFKPSTNVLITILLQIRNAMIYISSKDIVLIRYCASEILKSTDKSNYSEASDVYSFGVLMWETCSQGKVPYEFDTSDNDIRQRRLNDEQLLRPNSSHDQIWPIIESCLPVQTQPEAFYY